MTLSREEALLRAMDAVTDALIFTPLEETGRRKLLLEERENLAQQLDELDREAGRESAHECYADQR